MYQAPSNKQQAPKSEPKATGTKLGASLRNFELHLNPNASICALVQVQAFRDKEEKRFRDNEQRRGSSVQASAPSPRAGGGKHVYPLDQLIPWLEATLGATADSKRCVAFLCGAPGAGKSHVLREVRQQFLERVRVLSNDLQEGVYFLRDREVVFKPTDNPQGRFDFPWFRKHVLQAVVAQVWPELHRTTGDSWRLGRGVKGGGGGCHEG